MSVPRIPTLPSVPAANVVSGLLATIAIEEAALAHLVNAEAEKVQRLAGGMPTPSTFTEAAEMQKISLAVLNAIALKELILIDKLAMVPRLLPPARCPLSRGFWRTHVDLWPVDSLTLGCQTYDQAALLAILDAPSADDASLILADQLIAAKLNVANGSDPAPIIAAIEAADALLCEFAGQLPYGVPPDSPTGAEMVLLAAQLQQYNLGELTPNCVPAASV